MLTQRPAVANLGLLALLFLRGLLGFDGFALNSGYSFRSPSLERTPVFT